MEWQGEQWTPKAPESNGNFDTFGTAMIASSLIQAGAGMFAFGVNKANAKAQKATNRANGEIEKTSIMREYTDLLKKEADLVGSQKAIFSGANISWKSSVYQEAMFNSEENFLKNKGRQAEDLKRVDSQVKLGLNSINSQTQAKQGTTVVGTTSNLLGNYTTYKMLTR